MAKYFVYHKHTPENHKEVSEAWVAQGKTTKYQGQMAYCTCPSGKHEVFAILEGNSEDEVKSVVPEKFRGETTITETVAAAF